MKSFYCLLIILYATTGFSQTITPEFEFQLNFEDAVGNKDSVTLGYDALATSNIDTVFGELNILNQPWGNGLDVRVGNENYKTIPQAGGPSYTYWPIIWNNSTNSFLTKRQILSNYFCDISHYRSDTISIQFTTKNLSIKITWNGDLFANICNKSTSFYGGQLWSSTDLTNGIGLNGIGNLELKIEKELGTDTLYVVSNSSKLFPIATKRMGTDTIAFLQFIFETTNTSATSEVYEKNVHIYPNPFNDKLILQNTSEQNLKYIQAAIYASDGRLILYKKVLDNLTSINTKDLENGVYYLKIYDTNSNQFNSYLLLKK